MLLRMVLVLLRTAHACSVLCVYGDLDPRECRGMQSTRTRGTMYLSSNPPTLTQLYLPVSGARFTAGISVAEVQEDSMEIQRLRRVHT